MLDCGPSPTVPEVTNAAIMRAAPSSQRFGIYHRRILGLSFVQQLKTRLQQLNQQFRAEAALIGPDAIIGSTIVVLMICGRQSFCLWAGDSRFYRMRDGELSQLSRDQSYVQNLVDRGEIAPEAAASHPLANVVCNLVGGAEELVLEERHDALEPGDLLLLCSDGLTRALTDPDIAEILGEASIAMRSRPIDRACAGMRRA